jgi:hypothetical protein
MSPSLYGMYSPSHVEEHTHTQTHLKATRNRLASTSTPAPAPPCARRGSLWLQARCCCCKDIGAPVYMQQGARALQVEGVWGACVFDKEHRHCGWKDFGAPVYSTKSKGTAGGRSQGRMCACAKGHGHCPALLLRAHVCNERVAALLPQQVQGLPDW